MSDIVCVLSKSSGKIFRAKKGAEDLKRGDLCVIESELGGDLAVVIDSSSEVCAHTKSERDSVKVIRKATEDDQKKFDSLQRKERRAFEFCLQRIKELNLPMKLVMVRYFLNEKKGIFYYTVDVLSGL